MLFFTNAKAERVSFVFCNILHLIIVDIAMGSEKYTTWQFSKEMISSWIMAASVELIGMYIFICNFFIVVHCVVVPTFAIIFN